jgi:hypothetical protein
MTFTLIIFLYAYLIFLAVWAILSLIGLYHLIRFGSRMFGSYFIGLLFIIGSLAILFLTYLFLAPIDWQTQVSLFNNFGQTKNVFDFSNFN